jgi:magnesium-transporting ATPase (P-type)
VLDAPLVGRILLVSLLLLLGAFGLFLRELDQGHTLAEARTVAVNVFVLVETVYLFNCRSLTHSFWSVGLFTNRWFWGGIGTMAALQLLFTYAPIMNRLFATAPIGLTEWLEIGAFSLFCGLVIGTEKRLRLGLAHRQAVRNLPGSGRL